MEVAAAFDMRLSLDPLLPNAAVDRMLMEAVDPPKPPHTRLVRDLGRLSWLIKGGALLDLQKSQPNYSCVLAINVFTDVLVEPNDLKVSKPLLFCHSKLFVSNRSACVMLSCYVLYSIFQLFLVSFK